MKTAFVLCAAIMLAACGGAPNGNGTTTPEDDSGDEDTLPAVGDRPVLDMPLSSASPDVRTVWNGVQALLAAPLPAAPAEVGAYRTWLDDVFVPWMRRRNATITELGTAFGIPSEREPREQLFYFALMAWLIDDTATQVRGVSIPEAAEGTPGIDRYREVLDRGAASWDELALRAFQQCFLAAPQAPPVLREWEGYCQQRAGELLERAGAAVVEGSLSRDQIRTVMQEHSEEVRHCYNSELANDPDLAGRVAVRFVINPRGEVTQGMVIESTLNSEPVQGCLLERLRSFTFPAGDGEASTIVSYSFRFVARDSAE